MAPKIFLTGITGYVGGDIFTAVFAAHPDYQYTLLVRDESRSKLVSAKYPQPNISFVYGDLDASDVISKAAAEADIVIHTADSSDNLPAARAIAAGLAAGHTAENPGYWLHICGTGILQWYDETHHRSGQPPFPGEVYDDIADITRILTLPDQAYHRDCDRIVLAANHSPKSVKTAIVGPPMIYGPGRGPVNQRSIQVYNMAKFALEKGYAPYVGTGKVQWDHVHVHDLADLFVSLVDAALDPTKNKDPELFGERAYYFAEAGTHEWGEVAKWLAEETKKQGFVDEVKVVGTDTEGVKHGQANNATWGTNSRSTATRARKYLGWRPKAKGLREEIPDIVKGEAERIGVKPKFAA